MKVSVILPTYRREKDLACALDSLYRQRFDDFEILVIDDNDNKEWNQKVENIIKEHKEKYQNIPLLYYQNHPNLGSAKTRNVGIDAANGEFITFLDDDDIYLEEKISKQYHFMVEQELDYSITDINLYYANGKVSERRKRDYIEKDDVDSLLKYHLMYHMTGTDTFMFRTSYLRQIGGFAPIDIGDEFYLMQRAIEGKGKFGYLSGCDIKAFVHTGEDEGISSGEKKIKGENDLYEHKKQYFPRLDKKTIRYIKMRHFAVLAFAEIRRRRYLAFLINALKSFIISPMACVQLFLVRK